MTTDYDLLVINHAFIYPKKSPLDRLDLTMSKGRVLSDDAGCMQMVARLA